MTEGITIAAIAVIGTIFGSVTTGVFTLFATQRARELVKLKQRLKIAYQDIAALHRLEERYVDQLATEEKTAESWKRQIRKQLEGQGHSAPSKNATARECERRLQELA